MPGKNGKGRYLWNGCVGAGVVLAIWQGHPPWGKRVLRILDGKTSQNLSEDPNHTLGPPVVSAPSPFLRGRVPLPK